MSEPSNSQGLAGGSSDREHQRRVAARRVRMEGRLGHRLGGLVVALTDEPQSTRAWAQGAHGEREVARALANIAGVRVLHDLHVRGQRRNIDHVAVGPAGVFVIDAKDYRGEIRVRDVGGLFHTDERLFVGRRDRSDLAANMAWQVAVVRGVMAAAGINPAPAIYPVLCFVNGSWPTIRRPSEFRGVRLEGTNSIKELVAKDGALDPRSIDRVVRALTEALPVG